MTWNSFPYRLRINKTWLDKLGLKLPSTTDELREVLAAFCNRDPNENGKKDEIGLYGWYNGSYGENTVVALINSFVFYPGFVGQRELTLDPTGNTVTAPFADPAFRKALVYLNGLYKDGALAASLFTDNEQQFRATLNNAPNIVGITSTGSNGHWPNADKNDNFRDYVLIPPLTGPDGVQYTPYTEYDPTQTTVITTKARNPDLAFKFAESFYAPDISLIVRYGEKGVDYTQDPAILAATTNAYVEMGLIPSLSLLQVRYIWGEKNNKIWRNINPRYASDNQMLGTGNAQTPYEPDLPTSMITKVFAQHYPTKIPRHITPMLRYSVEDAERNAEAITNIIEYVKQSIAEFVIGTRNINTGWDAYLRELDNLGLRQWLSSAQATYNRQRAR
jgi:putative aldouronate transport system substrate-binding protein